MRIAFVGKGGSGKTTLAALFARSLAREGLPVLAIDADINQHLGAALGLGAAEAAALPSLGASLAALKEHLRGRNPRIPSVTEMVKTTPAGRGSRLVRLSQPDPLLGRLERAVDGVRLLATGPFTEDDLGVSCYHSKVGAAELLLNHLMDGRREYVVVDMTAGADSFASGMFTRFDLTALVVEPTLRSVGVHEQYTAHANGYGVEIAAVGNKVRTAEDLAFLRERLGPLLASLSDSEHVRAAERAGSLRPDQLEAANVQALRRIREALDARPKDWPRYQRQAEEMHRRNALSWANRVVGKDLTTQIDPEFRYTEIEEERACRLMSHPS